MALNDQTREIPLRRVLRSLVGSLEWELKITSWGGNITAFKESINGSRQQQYQQTIVLTHSCQKISSAQHSSNSSAPSTQNATQNAVTTMQSMTANGYNSGADL